MAPATETQAAETVVTSGGGRAQRSYEGEPNPITTQVIRHGLISAAEQMKRALERTAFSPIIYETYDFAAAIYDRDVRMLAQSESLAAFMGTMSFCVEGAVAGVGGEENLEPGDIIFYNWPYGTGSHQQDCSVVMPIFLPDGGELVGYAAIKAHFLDMGAKEPWCTDTTDVFQEGTIFPGVKMYSRGELVDDMWRLALANSRMPRAVAGDINAEVVAVRTGAARLLALIDRYGIDTFNECVERMFDHGEELVRHTIRQIPDGRYTGEGMLDPNGDGDPVPFPVVVEIEDDTVRVDLSDSPPPVTWPVNSPLPNTVSFLRVTIAMLASAAESPNEGFFRPLEVVTRPGSLFHAEAPSPIFMAGWPGAELSDTVLTALAEVVPEMIPACNCGLVGPLFWGQREETGEMWANGYMIPGGLGGSEKFDGADGRQAHMVARMRVTPVEIAEAKSPWLFAKHELAPDSGGAGRSRGGLGADLYVEALEEFFVTAPIERTARAPWGLQGGGEARSNLFSVVDPEGVRDDFSRATGKPVPKGSSLWMMTGGGGGFGPAGERPKEAVLADVREGYITEEYAREHYPHAFE